MSEISYHFVLSACAASMGISMRQQCKETKENNWAHIVDILRQHRVRPLFLKACMSGRVQIPHEYEVKLRKEVADIQKSQLLFAQQLLQILTQLNKASISAIPYKGSVLAQKAYHQIGLREFGDIDFIIDKINLQKVGSIMSKMGYKMQKQIPEILKPLFLFVNIEFNYQKFRDNNLLFHVEPHWSIGHSRAYQKITYNQVKVLSKQVTSCGVDMLELSNEGLYITTCIHHMRSFQYTLKELLDLATIVQHCSPLNWELVFETAKKWNAYNSVIASLILLNNNFDLAIPPWVTSKIKESLHIQSIVLKHKTLGTQKEPIVRRVLHTVRHDLAFADSTTIRIMILIRTLLHYTIQFIFFKR